MSGLGSKLAGVALVAGVAGAAMVWSVTDKAAELRPQGVRMARMAECPTDNSIFTAQFAPLGDLLSLTPMSFDPQTGETGRLGVATRRGDHPGARETVGAFAVADARVLRVAGAPGEGFSIDLQPCNGLLVRYEGLDKLSPRLASFRDDNGGVVDGAMVSGVVVCTGSVLIMSSFILTFIVISW